MTNPGGEDEYNNQAFSYLNINEWVENRKPVTQSIIPSAIPQRLPVLAYHSQSEELRETCEKLEEENKMLMKKLEDSDFEWRRLEGRLDKEREEHKNQIAKLENLLEAGNKIPLKVLEKVINLWREEFEFEKNPGLSICFFKEEDPEILNFIVNFEWPNMHRISFEQIALIKEEQNVKNLNTALAKSFPDKVKWFSFNIPYRGWVKIAPYFDSLVQALPKVTEEIYISTLELSQKEFEEIFKASHKVRRLCLNWISIKDLDDTLDFNSDLAYNISQIYLVDTANQNDNNFLNEEKMKIFANALLKVPSLLNGLDQIIFNEKLFSRDLALDIFSGFQHVTIVHSEYMGPM